MNLLSIEEQALLKLETLFKEQKIEQESYETIKHALEKQVSFQVTPYPPYAGKCNCGVIFLDNLTLYCGNCGQKLSHLPYKEKTH